MKKRMNNLVVAIYFHPEAYPPTLNAVGELSDCFDRITIVHRPHLHNVWIYPPNVSTVASGSFMSLEEQKEASLLKKIFFFSGYLRSLLQQCIRNKPAVILVYDTMSLYAYHLIRKLLPFKHKIWYHNHDVVERGLLRKYSVGWFAASAERKTFSYLDIFSLPTDDRLSYFPMQDFTGRYFLIPNFPSIKFFGRFYKPHAPGASIKIIFQGQVAPFRGIEQIIPLLSGSVDERHIELGLIGPCDDNYKTEIMRLCEQYNVSSKVFFDRLPYIKLPSLSAGYHIGIAMLSQQNIMTSTIGTASNKLYEYAAVGLPVIYYSSENLDMHLGKYSWALGADNNSESILEKLTLIVRSYSELSAAAHHDFMQKLNFETGFAAVKAYVCKSIMQSSSEKDY